MMIDFDVAGRTHSLMEETLSTAGNVPYIALGALHEEWKRTRRK